MAGGDESEAVDPEAKGESVGGGDESEAVDRVEPTPVGGSGDAHEVADPPSPGSDQAPPVDPDSLPWVLPWVAGARGLPGAHTVRYDFHYYWSPYYHGKLSPSPSILSEGRGPYIDRDEGFGRGAGGTLAGQPADPEKTTLHCPDKECSVTKTVYVWNGHKCPKHQRELVEWPS